MEQVAWGCVEARANPNQSNRVLLVSHRGYLRARVGQVAWGCVAGAGARANPNQSNRAQLVGQVGVRFRGGGGSHPPA